MDEKPNPIFLKRYKQSYILVVLLLFYLIVAISIPRNSTYFSIMGDSVFIGSPFWL